MGISDEEWLAAARARFAREGYWEPARAVTGVPRAPAADMEAARPLFACPRCLEPPALEVLRTENAGSGSLLRWCPRCCGIWAPRQALSDAISPTDDPQPAFTAGSPPPRCRSCGGALRLDETCTKCGERPPALSCPACHVEMKRSAMGAVTIDVCPGCGGLWFDAGELVRVYGVTLQSPMLPAAAGEDLAARDVAMDVLAIGANILFRLL